MNSARILLALAISMAILYVTYGAVSLDIVKPDPNNPDKCPVSEDEPALSVGETKTGPGCVRINCGKNDDGDIVIQRASCGVMLIPDECKLEEKLSEPYPDCCPQPVCPPASKN